MSAFISNSDQRSSDSSAVDDETLKPETDYVFIGSCFGPLIISKEEIAEFNMGYRLVLVAAALVALCFGLASLLPV